MVQLEEQNRITNYQLAFIKIQGAIKIMQRMANKQETLIKQKAITQLRNNADKTLKEEEVNSVIEELKEIIQMLIKIKFRHKNFILDKFLYRWRDNVIRSRLAGESTKEVVIAESRYKKELEKKDKIINGLEQKFRQQIAEVSTLKESEKRLKQTLKERERQELKESTNKRKVDTKLIENKLQELEEYVIELEAENRDLKEQLGSAEENVGGFLKEVNDIINSSQFFST